MRLTTIYQQLTQEQRINFWTILTNLFVVFFTFWLGLSVQDMIATRHSELNKRLAHYAYVDRFYNDMQNIEDYAYITTKTLLNIKNEKVTDSDAKAVSEFLKTNRAEIVCAAMAVDSTLRKFKYYCDNDKEAEELTSIMIAIPTYRFVLSVLETDSTISDNELRTMIQEKMYSRNYGLPVITNRKILDETTDSIIEIFKKKNSGKRDIYTLTLLDLVGEIQKGYNFLNAKIQNPQKQPSFFKRLNFSWESIVLLFILIVLAFFVSNLFVRFIAPKSIERNHSNEDFVLLKKEKERLENIRITNRLYIERLENEIKSLKKKFGTKD